MAQIDLHVLIPVLTLIGVSVLLVTIWIAGRRRDGHTPPKARTYARSLVQRLMKGKSR